jgi:hypothetical protein
MIYLLRKAKLYNCHQSQLSLYEASPQRDVTTCLSPWLNGIHKCPIRWQLPNLTRRKHLRSHYLRRDNKSKKTCLISKFLRRSWRRTLPNSRASIINKGLVFRANHLSPSIPRCKAQGDNPSGPDGCCRRQKSMSQTFSQQLVTQVY